ncbi:hypothetical protein CP532_0783, partial [Ophiocordyceps camponoti-leonardi (nom. inval.)]
MKTPILPILLTAPTLTSSMEANCTSLDCYQDMIRVAGSHARLLSQCQDGIFRDSAPRRVSCGKSCPADKCNRGPDVKSDEVLVYAHQYLPICECVRYNAIPSHCSNIACYRELAALAEGSGSKFREICFGHLNSSDDIRFHRGLLASAESESPKCEADKVEGDMIRLSAAQYTAACECGISSEWKRRPEYGDYIPWFHKPIFIDVFIHFIIKSIENLSPFNQPGVIEDAFQYSMKTTHGLNVTFTVKYVQIIVHNDWAVGRDNANMRRRLHMGDNRDLNLYFIERVSNQTTSVSPIDPSRRVYCTPPLGFPRWAVEDIGPLHQDGCIIALDSSFSSEETLSFVFQELERWFGFCPETGSKCPSPVNITSEDARVIHNIIAQTRFLPYPRATWKFDSERAQSPCENHRCFRELEFLFGSVDILAAHCRHEQLTRWSDENATTEDLAIRKLGGAIISSDNCGKREANDWVVPWSEYKPLCDCIREKSLAPRWSFTNETLTGVADDRPLHVDVFIHAIASSRHSPMAKRYFRVDRDLEDEFEKISAFYSGTKINFRIIQLDLRVNEKWAQGQDSAKMRERLYKGGSRDLNLYYIEASSLENVVVTDKPLTVYCSFPYSSWWAYLAYSEPEHDGCIVAYGALPSVAATAFQYWIGVMDPRQRSCSDPACGPEFTDLDKENITYSESPPVGLVVDAAKKGLNRFGNQGVDVRSNTVMYPGGVSSINHIPFVLDTLGVPVSRPGSPASMKKTGIDRVPGEPLGPNKKRNPRPSWSAARGLEKIKGMLLTLKEKNDEVKQIRDKAGQWGSIVRTHEYASRADVLVDEVEKLVHQAAEIIDSCHDLDHGIFGYVWCFFKHSRELRADIMAQEALQSVEHYVTSRWAERKQAAFDLPNMRREVRKAGETALEAIRIADRLGGQYLEKVNRLQSIQQSFVQESSKKNDAKTDDMAQAVSQSGAIFIESKEKARDALKREQDVLKMEIQLSRTKAFQDTKQVEWRKKELTELRSRVSELTVANDQLGKMEQNLKVITQTAGEPETGRLRRVLDSLSLAASTLVGKSSPENMPIVRGLVIARQMQRIVGTVRDLKGGKKKSGITVAEEETVVEAAVEPVTEPPAAEPAAKPISKAQKGTDEVHAKGKAGEENIASKAAKAEKELDRVVDSLKVALPEDMTELVATKSPTRIIAGIEAVEKTDEGVRRSIKELLDALDRIKVPKPMPGKSTGKTPIKVMLRDMEMRMEVPTGPRKRRALQPEPTSDTALWELLKEAEDLYSLVEELEMGRGVEDEEPATLSDAVLEEAEVLFVK